MSHCIEVSIARERGNHFGGVPLKDSESKIGREGQILLQVGWSRGAQRASWLRKPSLSLWWPPYTAP